MELGEVHPLKCVFDLSRPRAEDVNGECGAKASLVMEAIGLNLKLRPRGKT